MAAAAMGNVGGPQPFVGAALLEMDFDPVRPATEVNLASLQRLKRTSVIDEVTSAGRKRSLRTTTAR